MSDPGQPVAAGAAAAAASGDAGERTDSDGVPVGLDDAAEDVKRAGGELESAVPGASGDPGAD